MLKHIRRILYYIVLVLVLSCVLGFFTLGVWSIYGRTIAFWAMAALCVGLVALALRSGKPKDE